MKTVACLVFFVIVAIYSPLASAQIKINIAGKDYLIPYLRSGSDTNAYIRTSFGRAVALKRIERSAYEIELRAYRLYNLGLGGVAIILKGNDKNFFVETINYRSKDGTADSIQSKDYQTTHIGAITFYHRTKTHPVSDTLINKLIKAGLFTYNRQAIIDSLSKIHIEVTKPIVFDAIATHFELKVKDQYRYFYCFQPLYDANKTIQELAPEKLLIDLFNEKALR